MRARAPIRAAPCPCCDDWVNTVAPLDAAGPNACIARSGDVTFCANCAAMLVVNDDMLPQVLTEAQRTALRGEFPGLQEAEEQALGFALACHLSALFGSRQRNRT